MTTQDEVLKLCEAAGQEVGWYESGKAEYSPAICTLTRLITLAKQSAYEDAAKLCEQYFDSNPRNIATKIRNRANEVTK